MRYWVTIFFYILAIVINLACREASSASSSSSLVFFPGRRAIGKWSLPYNSKQGDQNVKGISFGGIKHTAVHGMKSTNQENSKAYSTETQNSSDMDVGDIVYNIDYHGATTHPTPTPKHPKP